MATATLVADPGARRGDLTAAVVTDILWTAAEPGDGLEHIHARVISGQVDLTFFHRAENSAAATRAAGRLCHVALKTSPALSDWEIAGAGWPADETNAFQ